MIAVKCKRIFQKNIRYVIIGIFVLDSRLFFKQRKEYSTRASINVPDVYLPYVEFKAVILKGVFLP